MTEQRVLVTGADGFVGTELCRRLVADGFRVRGALWEANDLPDGCEVTVVGDIGPTTDWSSALADVGVVVHLAARVHMMSDGAAEPLAEYRRVNVEGTRRLAEMAVDAGVRRFVFMSSIKVNGEQTEGKPFLPDDPPAPVDPYGLSKWEAEQALESICSDGGMENVIIRSPLVYGPGVKANFLRLFRAVDRGMLLPVGALRNKRSFMGLRNLADILVECVRNDAAAGEVFLVSDGEDMSTPGLVCRIGRALDRTPRLISVPAPVLRFAGLVTGKTSAVDRLCGSLVVDSSKVREALGWSPVSTAEEELARVAEWYRRVAD